MDVLLVAILALCSIVLIVMGMRQWRRRLRLDQFAHRCGLKFSWRDPFGLVQHYGSCLLTQAGHSAHVDGVLFGRYDDWPVRSFDFRFEVGHGPHRLVRRYTVIAAELPRAVPAAIVWRDGPTGRSVGLPIPAAVAVDDVWWAEGDATVGRTVRESWPTEGSETIGIETAGRLALFATPDPLDPDEMLAQFKAVSKCLLELAALTETDH